MYKSLLDYDLRNMCRFSISTLVLLAYLSFLLPLDAAASSLPIILLDRYRVGQVSGSELHTSNNSTFCGPVKYAPFTLFYDNLAMSDAFLSENAGTTIPVHFLTTFVSGTPEARDPESGATAIVGSQGKLDNYLTVCTYNKTRNILGDDAHSRINWLAWSGKLAPFQNSSYFFFEFENVGMEGKTQSCQTLSFEAVTTSDPFLVSAGLCGNSLYPGNIAAWVNRIEQVDTKIYFEVCVAIDIPHPYAKICAYAVGIESMPIKPIGSASSIIEAESVEIDFAKSRCIERKFKHQYDIAPFVFVSPSYHTDFNKSNVAPIAWVQYSNERGFKACVNTFGPYASDDEDSVLSNLSLDYAVIPINDGISNVEPISIRNAITITIQKKNFPIVKNVASDNNSLSPRMCHFFKRATGLYDMHCHADSFLESEHKLIMNFVLQHHSMGPDESALLHVKRKIEETLAMLYWIVEEKIPLDGVVEQFRQMSFEYGRDPGNMYTLEGAKSILESELLNKMHFRYLPSILDLIYITLARHFEVTVHQECIVSGFTSGNCSVPTCEPGVYNGTKLITREVLSTNTRANLCPTDMNYIVSCNQSPCELDKVSDEKQSGATLKVEKRGSEGNREEVTRLLNFAGGDSDSTNRAEGDNPHHTRTKEKLTNFLRENFPKFDG